VLYVALTYHLIFKRSKNRVFVFPRPEALHNAASSLCAAHRQNNEAASQWKGRVMDGLVDIVIV
jgi:hypothetical protein